MWLRHLHHIYINIMLISSIYETPVHIFLPDMDLFIIIILDRNVSAKLYANYDKCLKVANWKIEADSNSILAVSPQMGLEKFYLLQVSIHSAVRNWE